MPKSHYAIIEGKDTGVFAKPWNEIQPLVHGVSGARYKGFNSEEAAWAWYDQHKPADVARGGLVAYVDGSNRSDGSAASWSFIIGQENEAGKLTEIMELGAGRVQNEQLVELELEDVIGQRNILGETVSALECMRVLQRIAPKEPVVIFHDYIGIARWATGAWRPKKSLSQMYHREINRMMEGLEVHFEHVKGHTGVVGNEIADRLAGYPLGREIILPEI